MLRILKLVLLWTGAVLVMGAVGLLIWNLIQMNNLTSLVSPVAAAPYTVTWLLVGTGVALVGGFVLGCGVGLPRLSFKERLEGQTPATPDPPAYGTTPTTM